MNNIKLLCYVYVQAASRHCHWEVISIYNYLITRNFWTEIAYVSLRVSFPQTQIKGSRKSLAKEVSY